ncbi:MAG: F0F1 ATP synthase subunit epsilon [Alphaproteobacteria bacterium]
MAETVEFELVSPERLLISEQVEMVVVPGWEGNFGVLRGHAPLISTVRPGVIEVFAAGSQVTERIFVAGGFAEVTSERCTVLADQAMPVADIDSAAAAQQIEDATEDLADATTPAERSAAEKALSIARAMHEAGSA